MKKKSILILIACILLFNFNSCQNESELKIEEIHVYKPEEVKLIIANALEMVPVGDPIRTVEKTYDDSTNVTTTIKSSTQTYLVYVAQDKNNKLIPKGDVKPDQVSSMKRRRPIVVSLNCGMNCQHTGVTLCPDAVCDHGPTTGCAGSCGDCSTTSECKENTPRAFGFGSGIRF